MNKLPLNIEPPFQHAPLYHAFLMATRLLEEADNPQHREIAEECLKAILEEWQTTADPTAH